ncbi:nucleoside deaminase [Vineibacter terrae]|uniref:nucleoside deaminase n=1 Tax=Vineibacter terrae TaxID=2586908 RepID=UPI002E3804B6|nr:nucleoside deaminase [Vineibacter terrae]HEX2891243.1 nucleoside deaminase [Vineibacter terrae]
MTEADFMRYAIELSRSKMQEVGAAPFAALVVKDGQIVGEGWNTVLTDHDPTLHGEVAAIRDACRRLGTFDLSGCDIYTSCEPCAMCVAAIWWARLDRVFYANALTDTAHMLPLDGLARDVAQPIGERSAPAFQLMAGEAYTVIKEWVDSGRSAALMTRPQR